MIGFSGLTWRSRLPRERAVGTRLSLSAFNRKDSSDMRTALWAAIVIAGLGAGTAIGQEVVKAPGYYLPDGTPCGADGRPLGKAGHHHGEKAGHGGKASQQHHGPLKGNRNAMYRASFKPWHGPYYDPSYGAPIALVVPPTAERQTNYGWGVGNNRVSRIDAQFLRPYPGPGAAAASGYGFAPTPPWPSDTNQFGVYYVRGPW